MTDNGTEIIEAESRELVAQPMSPATLFGTDDPAEVVKKATARADALVDVVEKKNLYTLIGKKKHLHIEAWTFLGTLNGVFAVPAWTKPTADGKGWQARVEAKTMGGAVVGAAEHQCSRNESAWKNRDDFAIQSMAQTRAASKALRLPLGFIVTLAGYDPTPKDEMPDDEDAPVSRKPSHAPALVQQAVAAGGVALEKCRSCDAEITWEKTAAGKSMPMNLDGTSHFASCPQADKWRKEKPPSEDVQAALDRGHEKKPITAQAVRIRAEGLKPEDRTELTRILVEDYPHCKRDGKPYINKLSQAELAAVSATVDGMLKA